MHVCAGVQFSLRGDTSKSYKIEFRPRSRPLPRTVLTALVFEDENEVNYVRNIIKGCIFQKKKLPSVIKQNLLTVVAMRHITER